MKIGLLVDNSLRNFDINVIKSITSETSFEIKVVVIDDRPKKALTSRLVKNIRKGRGGYVFVMALARLFKSRTSKSVKTLSFFNNPDTKIHRTLNLYSDKTIRFLRNCNLDAMVLVGGFGILREPILSMTHFGILSFHHGDLHKYRGMPPGFWELYNNEKEMGITVQRLSSKLDGGQVLMKKKVLIDKSDTVNSLLARAYSASESMMSDSLLIMKDMAIGDTDSKQLGKLYTLPTFRQWLFFKTKLFYRRFFA